MARNGSGTYSVVNTLVAGNTITAAGLNQNFSDIGTELTNSVAADGQTTLTGQLKNANGTNSAPAVTFGSDLDSGFYRRAANSIGMALGGTDYVEFATASTSIANALHVAGSLVTDGSFAASASSELTGVVVMHGGLQASATAAFANLVTMSSTSHMKLPSGTTAQRPGTPAVGHLRFNTDASAPEAYNGAAWVQLGKAPTYQTLTATASSTYTTPTGAIHIVVRMAGGGGGGAGTTGAGGNATQSNFATTTAGGGTGGSLSASGAAGAGGAGGTGGTTGTGTEILRLQGNQGGSGLFITQTASSLDPSSFAGGHGGVGPFGGGSVASGTAGKANSGAGGGGTNAIISGASTADTGGGGGSGEYVEFQIGNPSATYDYAVGSGGAAGTGGSAGAGATGRIVVAEYYN